MGLLDNPFQPIIDFFNNLFSGIKNGFQKFKNILYDIGIGILVAIGLVVLFFTIVAIRLIAE